MRRFTTYSNPIIGVIGPCNKQLTENASPYAKSTSPVPAAESQRFEALRFFDNRLRGLHTGEMPPKTLYYFTMGEEAWHSTSTWPPAGSTTERMYFVADGKLSPEAPVTLVAADAYDVDFAATTGRTNRWHSHLLGEPVVYPDRAEADARLVTYTGAPLDADTEITGHPVIALHLTSTATDGAFFAYLESVAPNGRVSYLTEGELRAIHRKVSSETPPFVAAGPYHTFRVEDAQPLVPGEPAELSFALLPVSVVVPKGHRLRVAVAGHDADTFARIPAQGPVRVEVLRSAAHPSHVDLPVVRRPSKPSGAANGP